MKNYIIALIICPILFSCKKKETAAIPAPASNTGTPISFTSSGLPANTNSINGVFLATKLTFNSLPDFTYNSYACFHISAKPLQYINQSTFDLTGQDYAGTVKANNIILRYDTISLPYEYIDTVTTLNYSNGITWNIAGNNYFSGFNAKVSRSFPLINNKDFLPLSFSKTQTLTINIGNSNISNADSINILLASNSSYLTKIVPVSATSISFTPAELANIPIGNYSAQIYFYVKNYTTITIDNKTYVFVMLYSIDQTANVTP